MAGTPPTLPPLSFGPFVNQAGTLSLAALAFLQELWTAAFAGGGVTPGLFLLGYSDEINFNVTGDKAITLALPGGAIGWRASVGLVFGTSGTFATAQAGLYSLAFQQGVELAAPAALSAITATGLNTPNATAELTPDDTAVWTYDTIYLNVTTPEGGPSQGSFFLFANPLY